VHAMDVGAIPQQATQRTHLQVTVPLETMLALPGAPGADLEFSPMPISAKTVERLACDASVTRIVFDSESQVIDVGRAKRTISGPQRKALKHATSTASGRVASGRSPIPQDITEALVLRGWQRARESDAPLLSPSLECP
jgi:hypothetical protein